MKSKLENLIEFVDNLEWACNFYIPGKNKGINKTMKLHREILNSILEVLKEINEELQDK